MCEAIAEGKRFEQIPGIEKHAAWFDAFKDNYDITPDNAEQIIKAEIGKTFVRVLSDAGVFKDTAEGDAALMRFVDNVNQN